MCPCPWPTVEKEEKWETGNLLWGGHPKAEPSTNANSCSHQGAYPKHWSLTAQIQQIDKKRSCVQSKNRQENQSIAIWSSEGLTVLHRGQLRHSQNPRKEWGCIKAFRRRFQIQALTETMWHQRATEHARETVRWIRACKLLHHIHLWRPSNCLCFLVNELILLLLQFCSEGKKQIKNPTTRISSWGVRASPTFKQSKDLGKET